jgi:catabolite repression HPr-like protein
MKPLELNLRNNRKYKKTQLKNVQKNLRRKKRMVERHVEVALRTGLQARPAAMFVQEANKFSADIFLEKDGKKVNAKSIMGLMSLAVGSGTTVTLIADGNDEEAAVEALTEFVQKEA